MRPTNDHMHGQMYHHNAAKQDKHARHEPLLYRWSPCILWMSARLSLP